MDAIAQAEVSRMTAAQLEAERVTLNAKRLHFAGLGTRAGRIKANRIGHRIKYVKRALAERARGGIAMSDDQLKKDIATLDLAADWHLTPEQEEAWQRLKPRLTPDRERVRAAIEVATEAYRIDTKDRRSLLDVITDAAIDAMKETP